MAGKSVKQEIRAGSSMLDMKDRFNVESDDPCPFQIIVRDSPATLNSDLIIGDAVYSFVVSLEKGCKDLRSLVDRAPEEVKVQALTYLAKVGVTNSLATTTAGYFVGDANVNTSVEAMQTIAAVAEAGDQEAIAPPGPSDVL